MANGMIAVALSGGMDSACALAWAKRLQPSKVVAYSFDYGSKHSSYEMKAAADIANHYSVPFVTIWLPFVKPHFKSDLLTNGGSIPEGHYEDASMKRTVVPCRNMIFATILAGIVDSQGGDTVTLGVHTGDHAVYPDCRPSFINSLNLAVGQATEGRVRIAAPFIQYDKRQILEYGLLNSVPIHLTRTCYKNQSIACGKCGSCQERLLAFQSLALVDPLQYQSREILPRDQQESDSPPE